MGSRLTGLFVHFEGLATSSVIDAQVHSLVHLLRQHDVIDFDILAFAFNREIKEASIARKAEVESLTNGSVSIKPGIKPGILFSPTYNAALLNRFLKISGKKYDIIHARTDYSACVGALLRRRSPDWKLVWDCRGDTVAERFPENKQRSPLLQPYRFLKSSVIKRRRDLAARNCDAALFVTDGLRKLVEKDLNVPYEIIPSTASIQQFFFDPELRNSTRKSLGLTEANIVLIYSGGMSDYQEFPAVVEHFSRLKRQDERLKLLVLTRNIEKANKYLGGIERNDFRLMAAEHSHVNNFLNAADYAYLIRAPLALNAVASPTKFAEYCLAGLTVIMDRTVPDSFEMAVKFDNLCHYNGPDTPLTPVAERYDVVKRARLLLSREAIVNKYSKLYSSLITAKQ